MQVQSVRARGEAKKGNPANKLRAGQEVEPDLSMLTLVERDGGMFPLAPLLRRIGTIPGLLQLAGLWVRNCTLQLLNKDCGNYS